MIELIQAALLIITGVLGLGLLVWVRYLRAQAVGGATLAHQASRSAVRHPAYAHRQPSPHLSPQAQVETQL